MKNALFCQRLSEALSTKRIKQSELSQKTGINKGLISRYIRGEVQPIGKNLVKIAQVLDVSPFWLYGVEKLPDEDMVFFDDLNDVKPMRLTKDERDLIEMYRNAEPILRKTARTILNTTEEGDEDE